MKEKMTSEHSTPSTQRENNVRKSSARARWIAKTGILSAAAIALMYLEFSLPFFPGFLKFDFAEVPALLATFSMGPLTGIVVEFIKNLAHLPASHTAMVGELANFIICSAFVGVAGLIYRYNKTKKGAMISLAAGTAALTISGCLVNYFISIPFYINAMGFSMEAIKGAAHAAGNPFVSNMTTLIFYVFVPFNILKGLVISIIISLIYKKLSPLLHR
jgi:riboflavin transporter FmnP